MKRRLTWILTAVVLLGVGIAVAVGAGGSDPMLSKSYWENTYLPALTEDLRSRAAADTKSAYDAAIAKLDAATKTAVTAAGKKESGFTFTQLKTGEALELKKGASVVFQSGSGSLNMGALADVTTGREVSIGQDLFTAHRYVVTSDAATLRQSQAGTVVWQGDGAPKQGAGVGVGLGSGPSGGKTGLPFTDVEQDQWFYDAVAFVYQKGYFSGTGQTTFAPNAPMDRAMVATVLHRLAGSESVSAGQSFSDVPAGQWYSAGIAWANAKGVVNGMGDGTYAPAAPVTREQLVTMLYRFEKDYRQVAVPAAGSSLSAYPDGAAVSSWARDAMSWAVGARLIQGRNTGELDGAGTATRAEVATILQRFAGRM